MSNYQYEYNLSKQERYRPMNDNTYNRLSEDMQEIYVKYCLPDDLSGLTMDSVILSPKNKKKVDEFLIETQYKKKFMFYGLKPVNRLIASGASGTGKTFLAKCIAASFGYELLAIDIANALSTGVAATAIRDIFSLGNEIGNAIIFLDECDAIARSREDKSVPEDPNVRRANNAIFQQLDRMNPDCIFYAATNMFKELDTAFVSRFNVRMEFDRPPLDNIREALNKFLLSAFTIKEDMDPKLEEVILWHARNYIGLSYRNMQTWVERAEKNAIIKGREYIFTSEIFKYFMEEMRVEVGFKGDKPYLYQV